MTKFKIWDLKNKCWMISNCGKFVLDQKGKLWYLQTVYTHGIDDDIPQPEEVFDYEIVWYTGKTVKNNKELYDGDILIDLVDNNEFHLVEWDKDSGMYLLNYYDWNEDWEETFQFYESFAFDDFTDLEGFKCIGNRFENPEYLEGKYEMV